MTRVASAARSVIDVLRLSTEYLEKHQSASPRLDAELLLAHALGVRRIDLYLMHDRPLQGPELTAARELVRRRGLGEPVAYITGTREFYTRAFDVDPSVLIPRPETETLVEVALREVRARGRWSTLADLGTGSGCIAVTLAAELPSQRVVAVDSSEAALAVARRNAERLRVAERVRFVAGDWGAPLPEPADVVVSNPPYVTTAELAAAARDVRDFEPRGALDGGADGLDAYRALAASLHGRVRTGATILLEVDHRRAREVAALVIAAFPGAAAVRHQDLTHRDRVVEVRLA